MPRKSVRKDKSVYQLKREELGLTREEASELTETMSPGKLYRIEDNTAILEPYDVMELSKAYRAPELCSWYCHHECPIGEENMRDVTLKDLPQIAIEIIGANSSLDKVTGRLAEIVLDGQITSDEYKDFSEIEESLEKIALSVDNLKLWIKTAKANGQLKEYHGPENDGEEDKK